jgi:hypothetical protein
LSFPSSAIYVILDGKEITVNVYPGKEVTVIYKIDGSGEAVIKWGSTFNHHNVKLREMNE